MGRKHKNKVKAKKTKSSNLVKRTKPVTVPKSDDSFDGIDDSMKTVDIDGETAIVVECGANTAHLFVDKLCQGSKGQCVRFQDAWLTPNELQLISGRECAKDWKRSIKHDGKQLKFFFSTGELRIHKKSCGCVAGRTLPSCFRRSSENEELMPILSKATVPRDSDKQSNANTDTDTDANDGCDQTSNDDEASDDATDDECDLKTGSCAPENGLLQTNGDDSDCETDQYSENEYESVIMSGKVRGQTNKPGAEVADYFRNNSNEHKAQDRCDKPLTTSTPFDGACQNSPRKVKVGKRKIKEVGVSDSESQNQVLGHSFKKSAIDVYEFCDDGSGDAERMKAKVKRKSAKTKVKKTDPKISEKRENIPTLQLNCSAEKKAKTEVNITNESTAIIPDEQEKKLASLSDVIASGDDCKVDVVKQKETPVSPTVQSIPIDNITERVDSAVGPNGVAMHNSTSSDVTEDACGDISFPDDESDNGEPEQVCLPEASDKTADGNIADDKPVLDYSAHVSDDEQHEPIPDVEESEKLPGHEAVLTRESPQGDDGNDVTTDAIDEPSSPEHIQMPTLEPEAIGSTRGTSLSKDECDEARPVITGCATVGEALDFSAEQSEALSTDMNFKDDDDSMAPILLAETDDGTAEKIKAETIPKKDAVTSHGPLPQTTNTHHKESKLSSIIAELRTAKERKTSSKVVEPFLQRSESKSSTISCDLPAISTDTISSHSASPGPSCNLESVSDRESERVASPTGMPCLDGLPPDLKEKYYSSCIKSELEAQCRKRMLAKTESKLMSTEKPKKKVDKAQINHNIPGATTVRQHLHMRKESQQKQIQQLQGRSMPAMSISTDQPTKFFSKNETGKLSPTTGKTAEDVPKSNTMPSYDDYMKALAGIKPTMPMMTPEKLASRVPTASKTKDQQAPSLAQQQAYAILLEQLKSQEVLLQQGLYAQMLGVPFPMHSLPFMNPGMFMPQAKGAAAEAAKQAVAAAKAEASVKQEVVKRPTATLRKSPEHERKEIPAKRKVDCDETALDLSNKRSKVESEASVKNKSNCSNASSSASAPSNRGNLSESWTNHSSVTKTNGCTCNHNPKANMNNWDVQDVCRFIKNIPGCAPYVKQFQEHKVTGQTLPLLTSEQLTKCLKMTIGPALMLTHAVAQTISETRQLMNCEHCNKNTRSSVKVPAI